MPEACWRREQRKGLKKFGAIVSNGTIGRRLLNVEEAAQYLGLSVDTLHKWVQLRAIPITSLQINHPLFAAAEDFEKILALTIFRDNKPRPSARHEISSTLCAHPMDENR
jgi:hypothetical protein